jgi:hypothetical protein
MKVSVANQKNKVFRPFVNAKDMHLFFDKGINPFGGLLELLIKQARIESAGAGNYVVLEPYAGGKEIKFKSSLERNDVPLEALLSCPALVDAESPEQIQSYIDNFGQAVDAVGSDINSAEDLADKGVVFENMDTAVHTHEELVKKYFMTSCIPITDHKFIMLHAAVWSGGTFLYVPKGVTVDLPLQAYFRMNAKSGGQFEHTLIIADLDLTFNCNVDLYHLDNARR